MTPGCMRCGRGMTRILKAIERRLSTGPVDERGVVSADAGTLGESDSYTAVVIAESLLDTGETASPDHRGEPTIGT